VCTVTAGAAITAGQTVMSDATGQAIPWAQSGAYPNTNVALGVAMDDCANGADAEIALFAL
jgi:hypothetical protein